MSMMKLPSFMGQKKLAKEQVNYRDRPFLFYSCGGGIPCTYFAPSQQVQTDDPCAQGMCNKVIGPVKKCGYCMMWSYMNRPNLRELVLGMRKA